MRMNTAESMEDKIIDLHKTLVGKVGWLRMTTPKLSGDRRGSGHYVMRDGELVEGQGHSFQGRRAADGTTDMETARNMHNSLLKRQYFGKMPPKSALERF
eukprot:CAMPEP_0114231424 /NCGR_PEP_ID=MMETSP0058-20121206/4035_1 /TAXON_ID=36894 /ORGANISM="Pyramimonas parkeae, CCMP726" /LENGTH=99 /DNA_ID=CAMNT_0001342769 /DNA_START=230 /DNA_END=529 /DNA_ORIENTATION=+